jgi:paraquat-inducible protein B
MADEDLRPQSIPESRTVPKRHTRISVVWVIPILAVVIGAWVAVTRIESEGPKISLVFSSAEGLEAGKTKIKYRGVEVGTITNIRLSDDHRSAVAIAQMAPRTEHFLVDDTRFWVVRPRISGATVSGLGTLLSGVYIGMEIGRTSAQRDHFVVLETPPVVTGDVPGRFFALRTGNLGSLDRGTPVFFRRLQVGQVSSYALTEDGQRFDVMIFVKAPYDDYVTANTRFWQASGIDMQLSASGLSVQTQSLLSILIGGIAFVSPAGASVQPPAAANTAFTLFNTRAEAFEPPIRNPQSYEVTFNESVRGLTPGAPVEFRGIKVGEVSDIRAQVDARTFRFSVPVRITLDTQRMGVQYVGLKPGEDVLSIRRRVVNSLVAHGVRAQLRTGSLLTGALFITFDFFPGAKPATVDWSQNPPELPTIPGQLQAIEASVAEIMNKVNQMPLQQIGNNLNKTLSELDLTLASARGTLVDADGTLNNTTQIIGPNSAQLQQVDSTLQEVSRAARSIRVLADYLERHPEALLRGKKEESK